MTLSLGRHNARRTFRLMAFRRRASAAILMLGAALLPSAALAEIYHVDARTGDDARDGLTLGTAWRTLAKVRNAALRPGDKILLVAGSVWREPLVLTRSGRSGSRIEVGRIGDGPRPRIDAGGVAEAAIAIRNAEYVSVSGIEVTNDSPLPGLRFGVLVAAENFGVARDIRVSDIYVHDIRGSNERKDNGGIVFRALGPVLRTRFEGINIERNIIWRADRSGIAGISDQVTQARWFPSRNVVIRDNYLEDIGGDGIVPRGADGALVEHNIVRHAVKRATGYNVAIWQWSTDNTLIQLNEAAFTHGRYDGQGFDSDFNSRRTTIIHNYSHDNEGGFVLLCTPGRRNPAENIGNIGTAVRYNVSRNDGARIFQLSGAVSDATVEGNVVHVLPGADVQMVAATEWMGWASDIRFRGNVLAVAGTARYGHETGRNGPDYVLGSGLAPAQAIRFEGNRFLGIHADPPTDPTGQWVADYKPPVADWAVPIFDPAKPDDFAAFLPKHRSWMLGMLRRELGREPRLLKPEGNSSLQARR